MSFIRWAAIAASASGALAVALGAFAAHALEAVLDPEARAIYTTAVRYHTLHTLALLTAALAPAAGLGRGPLVIACGAWLAGIVIFSGSLYLLALTGHAWLGAITPIGGLALLGGWGALGLAAWRGQRGRT